MRDCVSGARETTACTFWIPNVISCFMRYYDKFRKTERLFRWISYFDNINIGKPFALRRPRLRLGGHGELNAQYPFPVSYRGELRSERMLRQRNIHNCYIVLIALTMHYMLYDILSLRNALPLRFVSITEAIIWYCEFVQTMNIESILDIRFLFVMFCWLLQLDNRILYCLNSTFSKTAIHYFLKILFLQT